MKITDQSFTERLPGQTQTGALDGQVSRGSNARTSTASGSDTLQLSSLAAQLQKASASDGDRASRLSAIAQAVQSNTFRIDSGSISNSIVSEAIQSGTR